MSPVVICNLTVTRGLLLDLRALFTLEPGLSMEVVSGPERPCASAERSFQLRDVSGVGIDSSEQLKILGSPQ
jgi:hypothetical protein